MADIKKTCTSLTSLLHTIRDKKKDGNVEDELIADAMALFAQLSGQHHNLLKQAEMEYEKIDSARDECEEKQEVLDEQVSYIKYLDTEYDVRPWRPTDDVIVVNESDTHLEIKEKLDTELLGRRKMCEYGNTLEEEVSTIRSSQQEMRSELEKLRKVMLSMTTPSSLEGITPCQDIPSPALTGPLFTLHQLLSATLREYEDIELSVSCLDPLEKTTSLYSGRGALSDEIWELLEPSADHLILRVRGVVPVVIRYHPKMKVVSCDHGYKTDVLACLVPDDSGLVSPHTALDFAFENLPGLIASQHCGRLYCWLQRLAGLDVVTEKQRIAGNVTTVKFVEFLLKQ